MYINNTSTDEELSYYKYTEYDFNLINPYLNESLNQEDKYYEDFENEFNKVFFNVNIENPIQYKDNNLPYIREENSIKSKKKFIKKEILMNAKNIKDKYFPFTPGVGIKKCLEKIGITLTFISSHWIRLSFSNEKEKEIKKSKFKIIDFSNSEKGRVKSIKKKRKFKPDNIRKKIKTRFHKVIKNVINLDLIKAGSKNLFDFFPQNFISNINTKLNHFALNYTYEELIRKDIVHEIMNQTQNDRDLEKFNRNLEVLNYIDQNENIFKLSLFSKIRKMKYKEIFKAYFLSSEFEETIIDLYKKGEKIDYIEDYINKSINYVNFFSSYNPKTNGRYVSDYKMPYNDEDSNDYN